MRHAQVAYCEEQVECRRAVLLAHFGESFDPKRGCHGTCDVCAQHSGQTFEQASACFGNPSALIKTLFILPHFALLHAWRSHARHTRLGI